MSDRVFGDWGTSRLRLVRMRDGVVVDRLDGPGIGALPAAPEHVLRETLAPWLRAGGVETILLTGMVGSRNGWREVPYVACPAGPTDWAGGAARLALDDISVAIAPGLALMGEARQDVMRGEETQIFGACVLDPDLARGRHRLVLPGTHSKWAVVEDGRVTSFTTFLTGELFALLCARSTLLRVDNIAPTDQDDAGFAAGLDRADAEAGLIGTLFEARSAQLLAGRSSDWARAFLSGLLIGSEIAALPAAQRDRPVSIIGDQKLAAHYAAALAHAGVVAHVLDAEACVIAGLSLLETSS